MNDNAVKTFADHLLQHGPDNYGPKNTPIRAAILDASDHSVPIRGVPATQGVRPYDRAVTSNSTHATP
jgi:hypothetical protein